MAKGAGFVAAHRKLFVVQHGFAEKLDLLELIVRRGGEPIDRLRLDPIDLGLDLRDLFKYLRCKGCAGWLDVNRGGTANGNEKANYGAIHQSQHAG